MMVKLSVPPQTFDTGCNERTYMHSTSKMFVIYLVEWGHDDVEWKVSETRKSFQSLLTSQLLKPTSQYANKC